MDSKESTEADEVVESYADAAPIYRKRGWDSPFPLPKGRKSPPPKGATGRGGKTPNPQQITAWRRRNPDSNIGLWLPDDVIGIDVDAYGDKTGRQTLAEAEKLWGPLPPTVISTSRDDRVSGIRLYRIPQGVELPGDIKLTLDDGTVVGDIEIVQWFHRYVVAWPSLHPSGQRYRWVDSDWTSLPLPPQIADLPYLPEAWLQGLSAAPAKALKSNTAGSAESSTSAKVGETAGGAGHHAEFDAAVSEALTEGPMSPMVLERFTEAVNGCAGPGRHDTIRNHVMALLRHGYSGEPGVRTALLSLRSVFTDAVADDRKGGVSEATTEFHRMVTGAGRLLAEGALLVDLGDGADDGERQDPAVEGEQRTSINVGDRSEWKTIRFSEAAIRPVEWLWQDYLPRGKLVMLDGDPKLGKSSAALDWAATLSSGGEWPDGTRSAEPADVLFIGTEDGLDDTLAPRALAAGADMDRIHYVQGTPHPKDPEVLLPPTLDQIGHMRRLVEKHGIRLVIVDVLMAHLGSNVDSHKDQDIRRVLSPLAKMADETGCTVLLLRHLNKNKGGSALYRGSGSIGIGGAARALLLVTLDPDDHNCRVLASPGGNLGALPTPLRFRIESCEINGVGINTSRVEWLGPAEYTADELLSEMGGRDDSPELDAAEAWLEDYLTANGKVLGQTVKAEAVKAGLKERTLQRAAGKLKREHMLRYLSEGYPRVTYWQWAGGTALDADMKPVTPPAPPRPPRSDLPDDADSIKVWLADYLTIHTSASRKAVTDAAVKSGVIRNTKTEIDDLEAAAAELKVTVIKAGTPRVDHWELPKLSLASEPEAEAEQ